MDISEQLKNRVLEEWRILEPKIRNHCELMQTQADYISGEFVVDGVLDSWKYDRSNKTFRIFAKVAKGDVLGGIWGGGVLCDDFGMVEIPLTTS